MSECTVAPEAGLLAPDFLVSASPHPRRLSDYRGQPVVLAFYPPGWDPSRAEQLEQYRRILAHMPELGTELVDLRVDADGFRFGHAGQDVRLPLLAYTDLAGDVARRYGVAGREALFVIDEAGVIRWRYIAPLGASPSPDDLARALRALRPEKLEIAGSAHGETGQGRLTRRQFLAAALATAFALALGAREAHGDSPAAAPAGADTIPITLNINGSDHAVAVEPRVTLLDALRDRLRMTGSKKGCDHGQCGACTVLIDGRRVLSCLTLAMASEGSKITTIEGLADGDTLHPLQAAFIEHDGFQCGYCTSGQIMSAAGLLKEPCGPADDDVREAMSGNICRCGAYPNIVAAIQEVRKANNAPV